MAFSAYMMGRPRGANHPLYSLPFAVADDVLIFGIGRSGLRSIGAPKYYHVAVRHSLDGEGAETRLDELVAHLFGAVGGEQIGRASCRERVYVLV